MKLTTGERRLVLRRRNGRTQRDEADRQGVTLYRYQRMEADDRPAKQIQDLAPHERCFLLRRRSGMNHDELSEEIGLSREWIRRMEYGEVPADRLVEFWENRSRPWLGSAARVAR